jgi:hypothetical protein
VIWSASCASVASDSPVRSSCAAAVAAAFATSLILWPLCATLWTDRASSSVEATVSSTVDARLSVIAVTSSMEAAVSLIEEEVSSALAARSSALAATP